MKKKLTINLDEKIYQGLYSVVERGKIGKFIENLLRPYIFEKELLLAYQEMAKESIREVEAKEWIEGLIN